MTVRTRPGDAARPGPLGTPDGRYLVVRGRLWRRSDPRPTRHLARAGPSADWFDSLRAQERGDQRGEQV